MNFLIDSLYFVTSGLLIPCVAYLLYLLLQSLLTVGNYFGKRHRERGLKNKLADWVHKVNVGGELTLPEDLKQVRSATVIQNLFHCQSTSRANYLLTEYEVELDRQLGRFSTQAKLGPIIGLMGTLIPMGPALQGLANGDMVQLATQMQVAFTTTVVGLIIGALGFVMFQIERRTVIQELALLDLLSEILEERRQQ